MKSLNRFDLAFPLAIVAVFALATWLLYEENPGSSGSSSGEIVGTITYKNRFAERKTNGEMLWVAVDQRSPVYNEDTVRTDTGSSAVIHLKNETEISLGEQTMVLVSVAIKSTKIRVTGGLLAVRRTGSTSGLSPTETGSVTVATTSGSVSLTSGAVSMSDSAAGTMVSVESGTATVFSGSKTEKVSQNSVVGLGSAPEIVSFVPVAPSSGQTLFQPTETTVDFRWVSHGDGDPEAATQLLVASDSTFSKVEYEGKALGNHADLALPEGTHYWKLKTKETETFPRWFNIVVQRPPRGLEPDHTFYKYADALPLIGFSWLPCSFASAYRVEIYAGEVSEKPLLSSTTTRTNLTVDSLKDGDYQWRVVAISGQAVAEMVSRPLSFSIRKNKLNPPSDMTGKVDSIVSAQAIENGAVLASWREVEGADSYEAVVTRDPAGADVVTTVDTPSNFLRLEKSLRAGVYFVRVRAISGSSRSESSLPLAVRVVGPLPLRTLIPCEGASLDPTNRSLLFRWTDPNEGNRYRVLFSSDGSFDHPAISKDSAGEQTVVVFPEGRFGAFFWKVEYLDGKGFVLASSSPASFFLPKLFEDPEPISPRNGERVDVNTNKTLRFVWKPIPDASEYEVTLYRMSGGLTSPIQCWKTNKTSVELNDFTNLSTDPYAWDISARNASQGKLLGQSRTVLSYFRIIQSHPLEAPRNVRFGEDVQP